MPRRARPVFPQRSPPTSHVWKWPLAGTFSILRINIQPLDRTCSPYRFKRYSSMDRKSLQDTAPRLPIGVMSQRTGCNIETIRYYERSEEHTSELQSLMRISYAVFCLKKKKN